MIISNTTIILIVKICLIIMDIKPYIMTDNYAHENTDERIYEKSRWWW